VRVVKWRRLRWKGELGLGFRERVLRKEDGKTTAL